MVHHMEQISEKSKIKKDTQILDRLIRNRWLGLLHNDQAKHYDHLKRETMSSYIENVTYESPEQLA